MSEKQPSFTAHAFQEHLNQGQLFASRCRACQRVYLPVRALCPDCDQADLEWIELSGKGKLIAFTSVYIGPSFMIGQGYGRDKPYLTGIVELEEGPRISARLLGLDPLNPALIKIGMPLAFTVIEMGGEQAGKQLAFQVVG